MTCHVAWSLALAVVVLVSTATARLDEATAKVLTLAASATCDGDAMRAALAVPGVKINAPDDSRHAQTALHLAAHKGHVDCVAALLDAGAEVEAVDRFAGGLTPLHRTSNVEVLRLLVKHGANIDRQTADGKRVIENAVMTGNWDVFDAAFQLKADVATLTRFRRRSLTFAACSSGYYRMCEVLVNTKLHDLDQLDTHAMTMLGIAAAEGHLEVVELLLSSGADPNVAVGEQDASSMTSDTAFTLAVKKGRIDVITALAKDKRTNLRGATCEYMPNRVHLDYQAWIRHLNLETGQLLDPLDSISPDETTVVTLIREGFTQDEISLCVDTIRRIKCNEYYTPIQMAVTSGYAYLVSLLRELEKTRIAENGGDEDAVYGDMMYPVSTFAEAFHRYLKHKPDTSGRPTLAPRERTPRPKMSPATMARAVQADREAVVHLHEKQQQQKQQHSHGRRIEPVPEMECNEKGECVMN